MSILSDRSAGPASSGVEPGSGAERGEPARAEIARSSRRWLRRPAAGASASRSAEAPSPGESVPDGGSAPLAPAEGAAAVPAIAGVSGVAAVAPVTLVAEGVDVAPVGAVAPESLEGSGEPRRRRLRWVGWIKGRVIHEDRVSKFT
jgi:predicted phage gp36 major capsid-like protein